MSISVDKARIGEVRAGQVIHTFGVGALVDLPKLSGMVMGLGEWEDPTPKTEVAEPRLLSLVQSMLGSSVQRMVNPPAAPSGADKMDPFNLDNFKGVPVRAFPGWVRCPNCDLIAPLDHGVFRLEANVYRPDRTCFVHTACSKSRGRAPQVVPVRFLRTCAAGHLDDFPWHRFVHGGKSCDAPLLRLREFGVSAEAADIMVQCECCGKKAFMTQATGEKAPDRLGPCTGVHPHLWTKQSCDEESKAILAGASNIWFSVSASALSIPSGGGSLVDLLEEHWATLRDVANVTILQFIRKQGEIPDLANFEDDEVMAAIEAKLGDADVVARPEGELRREEWDTFSSPSSVAGSDNFRLKEVSIPKGWDHWLERVVLVERLRAVKALVGFTRLYSPGDYADLSELPEDRRVPLARKAPDWVPAAEVRGEGLFLQFREDTIQKWLATPSVVEREAEFREAHRAFREARRIPDPEQNFPGMRYVLLHSFSHALLRQLAVECGYGAASLEERIYSSAGVSGSDPVDPMAGVLLYTAASDSEGTLGGLVSMGRPEELGRHLRSALLSIELCASDPLCSEHLPGDDTLTLHGACCHACIFAAETSCEKGNKYLDRSTLMPSFGGPKLPFFGEDLP